MAEGIDAESAPKQARADRRMPLAVFQALHFIGQMAQRRQDHAPRELGGGGIRTAAPAAPASGDHDAVLGTGSDIEVIGVAPRLADALEIGQALDDLTGQGHPLLREQQRVAPCDLRDDARRVGVGIGVDDDLVLLQPGVGTSRAKDIGVVVNHGDLHAGVPSRVSWSIRMSVTITPEAGAVQTHCHKPHSAEAH